MNETILVVDDEREIADLLEIYLKNDGYTVHTCATGAEALRCAAWNRSTSTSPCLT